MAKIMLVEDDNNLREIYQARLQAEGYEIVAAQDGEEALALAVKERPDLIISDVMMPKISGFDMLDILRGTPEVKDTKVIMMTALSQLEDKARADKLGADRYLVKSQVTLEDVARVAREVLEGKPDDSAGLIAPGFTPSPADPATATIPTTTAVASEPIAVVEPVTTPAVPAAEPAPEPALTPVTPFPTPTAVPTEPPAPPEPSTGPPLPPDATPPVATPTDGATDSPKVDEPATQPQTTNNTAGAVVSPVAAQVTSAPVIDPSVVTEPALNVPPPTAAATATPTSAQPTPPVSPEILNQTAKAQSTEQEEGAIKDQIEEFITQQTGAQFEELDEPEPIQVTPFVLPGTATEPAPVLEPTPPPAVPSPTPPVVPSAPLTPASPPAAPPVVLSVVPEATATTNSANINNKKVITPLNNITQGPDLNKLVEEEVARAAATVPVVNPGVGAVISQSGAVSTEVTPNFNLENSVNTAPGQTFAPQQRDATIIQPATQVESPATTAPPEETDPNIIAL